jgi:hypothetical protein
VNIYEVHNNGNWYNFGFVFGLSIVFGSGSRATAPASTPSAVLAIGRSDAAEGVLECCPVVTP